MASALNTLLGAFWGICTLRLAPQDLPRSGALLALASLANVLCSVAINQLQLDLRSAVLVAVLEMGVLIGVTAVLLLAFRYPRRLTQTLTALMGTGAVIGALVFALLVVFPQVPPLARLAVFVWNLLVMGHILRHALAVHIAAGFVIAIGYALALMQLIRYVDQLLGGGG